MAGRAEVERERVRSLVAERLFGAPAVPPRLGRYEVRARIGRGASSVVYAGWDAELEREVALKLLDPDEARGAATRQRLVREGRALARLSHPNVLRVFEIGDDDGALFLAVELVDGGDLERWLGAAPRSWRDALDALCAAGEGLHAAHEVGLVHRDVKPRNILVDSRGRVRVADFGLVSPGGAIPTVRADAPVGDASLTRTGALLGSPAYMAPEQWTGGSVDARTDQFGFAVTLWEALYGERPFAGATEGQLRDAVVSGRVAPTPPREVPEGVARVVRRALAVDPDERFESVDAMVRALRSWRDAHERVEEAQAHVAVLEDLDADPAERDRAGAAARVAYESALRAWPEDPRAAAGRARLLERLFARELAEGDLDSAASLLAAHGDPHGALAPALEDARAQAAAKDADLERLDAIDREGDESKEAGFKADRIAVGAVVFVGFALVAGYLTRHGVYRVGNLELAGFFGVLGGMLLVQIVTQRAKLFFNRINQVLSMAFAVMHSSNAALFVLAASLGTPTPHAMAFMQAVLLACWLGLALLVDLWILLICGIAAAAAAATVAWPSLAFEIYAVATGVAMAWLVVRVRGKGAGPTP